MPTIADMRLQSLAKQLAYSSAGILITLLFSLPAVGQESVSGKLGLSQIELQLSRYYGGLDSLEEFRSISLAGKLEQGGETYDVTVFRKRSNLYRVHLEREGYQRLTIAYDGERAWVKRGPKEAAEYFKPEGGNEWLRVEALFENPILNNRLKQPQIKASFGRFESELGQLGQYIINVRYLDGIKQEYYLDAVTLLTVKVVSHMLDGTTIETRYSDYRTDLKYPAPTVVENWVGEKMVNRYTFSEIEINKGLLIGFFEKPQ